MFRQCLALFLGLSLSLSPGFAASKPAEAGKSVKERVLSLSEGTVVEVRTVQKEKIRGRLGPLTGEGFQVKRGQGDKSQDVTVAFANARSIKVVANGHASSAGKTEKAAWMIIGGLVAVGVIWGVLLATGGRN